MQGVSSHITALYSENEYVKHYPFPLNNNLGRAIFPGHEKRIYKWNRRYSRWMVRHSKFDVFHPTYYDPYFIKYIKKPVVITVHDMLHELYPHYFPDAAEMIARKRAVISKADALIAISENTRKDIIKVFPEKASQITVVYHGYTFTDIAPAAMQLPQNYILFIGERWHYKNFPVFAQAVSSLLLKQKDLHLICAGGKAFDENEITLLKKLNILEKTRQINATDAQLKQLYQNASVFVFPSKLEGFGLPLLEAFANSCPVACSNTSSLPEVAGDAVVYFDPETPQTISNAVERIIGDTNEQERLREKGRARLQQFPFNKCLEETLSVYKTLTQR